MQCLCYTTYIVRKHDKCPYSDEKEKREGREGKWCLNAQPRMRFQYSNRE